MIDNFSLVKANISRETDMVIAKVLLDGVIPNLVLYVASSIEIVFVGHT